MDSHSTSEGTTSSSSLLDQLHQVPVESRSSDSQETLLAAHPRILPKKRKSYKLQKLLKPRQTIVKRYFTAGVLVNAENARDVQAEGSPFAYPKDLEEFAYKVVNKAWRDDERVKQLQQKYFNRTSYKDRQKMDLLNRLYVDVPPMQSMKTMIDLDQNYYDIVQGRPIPDRLDIREYIQTVRDSLRTKIITGYRQDDIMLIDETLTLEQKIIDIVKSNLHVYINTFEEFLLQDHSSAMSLLAEADFASKEAYTRYAEYKSISQKYCSLQTSLYTLEEKWRVLKLYQRFLHSVSPLTWRMEQEQCSTRRPSIYISQYVSDDEKFTVGTYRTSILNEGLSLEDILTEFRKECASDKAPEIYFKQPDELMEVFRFMEIQNLNALLHSEELAVPLEETKDSMRMAVEAFDKEINNFREIIAKLEGGISWEEEQAMFLENLAVNLLKNEFKILTMSEEVLNLHVIVEDVYERSVGKNDANMDVAEMMKAIEEKYREELLHMDKIPSEQVALLESTYYAEEVMVMKLAEQAARDHAELERITANLNKAFQPPKKKKHVRELKKRSPPIKPPKKVYVPPRSLTKTEEEYLEFFTEFCKYSDDPREYGIDTSPESQQQLAMSCEPSSKSVLISEDEVRIINRI